MPSLQQRIVTLERTTTAQLPSSTEPITTLGEFLRVEARLAASSKHSARSSTPEEEARDKIDYLRLLDVFRNGVLLELAREFEEVYAQGPAAAERFLQESGLSAAESRRFREAWIPATQDPASAQIDAGEGR